MFEQYFLQISSNSEMVKLESFGKFVELTRSDPCMFDCLSVWNMINFDILDLESPFFVCSYIFRGILVRVVLVYEGQSQGYRSKEA